MDLDWKAVLMGWTIMSFVCLVFAKRNPKTPSEDIWIISICACLGVIALLFTWIMPDA